MNPDSQYDPSKFSAPLPPDSNSIFSSSGESGFLKHFFIVFLFILFSAILVMNSVPFWEGGAKSDSFSEGNLQNYSVEESNDQGFNRFIQHDLGFSIDFPSDWSVEVDVGGLPVLFMNESESFDENVSISMADLSESAGISLDDYQDAAYGQLLSSLQNYVLLERGEAMFGNHEGRYLWGEYGLDSTQETLQVLSLFTIQEDVLYLFTHTFNPKDTSVDDSGLAHMKASFEIDFPLNAL